MGIGRGGGEGRVLGETADRNWEKAVVFAAIRLTSNARGAVEGAYRTGRDSNCVHNGVNNLEPASVLQTRLATMFLKRC